MRWGIIAAVILSATGSAAVAGPSTAPPPLFDPVILNVGFVCRWEARCMDRQKDSMKSALKYVRKRNPPAWRIQMCNRNAGRKGQRVDWVGFDHCIRNELLRPAAFPTHGGHYRRLRAAG